MSCIGCEFSEEHYKYSEAEEADILYRTCVKRNNAPVEDDETCRYDTDKSDSQINCTGIENTGKKKYKIEIEVETNDCPKDNQMEDLRNRLVSIVSDQNCFRQNWKIRILEEEI